ncbi:hypothetical protein CJF32_00000836 [Rutstroemia sp. NJR-2017a WRK4]|nr:hypothetical protein CJF32_00000836 [Rutstroemia sp. NJR-2017a WRK4]
MSEGWSHGGPQAHHQNFNNNYNAPPSQARGRPPICFTCGQEGHFVKDCPKQNRNAPVMSGPPAPDGNGFGFAGAPQRNQWANGPNNVPPFQQPGQNPRFNGQPSPAPYVAPNPPYQQQYPTQGPPQQQSYQQPPQQNYSNYPQNQQYGPPAANGPYFNQPAPQQHNAQPPQQYGPQGPQSYQAPYSQYPPSNPPQQHGPPAFQNNNQQFTSPAPPYQQPPQHNNGYSQNQGYHDRTPSAPYQGPPTQGHNTPQWSSSPPGNGPFRPPPQGAPQQQQQLQQPNPGFRHDSSRSQSQQRRGSHQSQSRANVDFGPGNNINGSQHTPQTTASTPNSAQTAPHYNQNQSQPVDTAIPSSADSTPYGSPASKKNNISQWDGQPPTPRKNSDRSQEEKQFNWDFKKIFCEEKPHETVALAHPLANKFDMTPVPLLDKKSTSSVSRYARKENLKEYTKSVRNTPQWPYLQEDPAFHDSSLDGPLIPLNAVRSWMESRHGTAYVRIETRKSSSTISRKRKASVQDEQEDIDQQLQSEVSSLQNKRRKIEDGPSNPHDGLPSDTGVGNRDNTPAPAVESEADGDIWAPQPGEVADPTEALLASLGVSGAPKPVEPGPPIIIPPEHFQQPPINTSQPNYNPPLDYNSQPIYNPPLDYNQQPNYHPQPNYNPQPNYHPQPNFNLQPDYNPPPTSQPFQHNSGYGNTAGPYNRGPHPQMYNAHMPPPPPPLQPEPIHDPWPVQNISTTPPPPEAVLDDEKANGKEGDEENSRDESPLSPTSMEILGKLTKSPVKPAAPRKIIRVISGKKSKEAQRQADDTTPKSKRSQPVVAEAYRYVPSLNSTSTISNL